VALSADGAAGGHRVPRRCQLGCSRGAIYACYPGLSRGVEKYFSTRTRTANPNATVRRKWRSRQHTRKREQPRQLPALSTRPADCVLQYADSNSTSLPLLSRRVPRQPLAGRSPFLILTTNKVSWRRRTDFHYKSMLRRSAVGEHGCSGTGSPKLWAARQHHRITTCRGRCDRCAAPRRQQ